MRPSLAVFAGAIVSVSAASSGLWTRQQFPSCAGPCLTNANFGSCQPNGYGCLCESSVWINSVNSCLVNVCSGVNLQNAVSGMQDLCSAVGITLTTLPTTATAPTSPSTSAGSTTTTQAATTSNAALANSITPNALAGIIVFGLGALAL